MKSHYTPLLQKTKKESFLSSYRHRSIFRLLQVQGEGCCPRRGVCLRATLWLWCFFQTRPGPELQTGTAPSQSAASWLQESETFLAGFVEVPGFVLMAKITAITFVRVSVFTQQLKCVWIHWCVFPNILWGKCHLKFFICKSFTCNQSKHFLHYFTPVNWHALWCWAHTAHCINADCR